MRHVPRTRRRARTRFGAPTGWKLEAERLLVAERPQRGCSLTILRPAYFYGPGNNLYRGLSCSTASNVAIPSPCPSAARARSSSTSTTSLRLVVSVLEAEPWEAEAFNCAHPEPVGWGDLVRAAAAAAGVEPRIVPVDYRGAMEAREFFPFRDQTYLLDTGKATRFGLAQPSVALAEGMRSAYAWYCRERPRLADPKMTRVGEALRRG